MKKIAKTAGRVPGLDQIQKMGWILEENDREPSGWSNYSCMVISQMMIEREMGNLGSKSPRKIGYKESNRLVSINRGWYAYTIIDVLIIIDLSHLGVKEQRVDSSYYIKHNIVYLRYTLIVFERNSLVRILSNQNINKRLYSTINTSQQKIKPFSIKKSIEENNSTSQIVVAKSSLNPWFITGFTDGDGSFSVTIAKKKTGIGWKVQPAFSIGLDAKDLPILEKIKAFFNVGDIYKSSRGVVYYSVGSRKDLLRVIIPHFYKYPLLSIKIKDYELFKAIIILMDQGEHKTMSGILKIVSLKASLNKGLSEGLKVAFPNVIPAEIPVFYSYGELEPHWISGFITAEGTFFISLYEKEERKAGYAVSLVFSLSQHKRDHYILERLASYFKCGKVRVANTRNSAEWIVTKSVYIKLILIPFLNKYPLSGVKSLDFERFKKAAYLIENKVHLSKEGFLWFKRIKEEMHKGSVKDLY